MLNFRSTTITMLVILLAGWLAGMPWYFFVSVIFVYSLALVYGSARVDSQFYLRAICSGPARDKRISLSFDDGPMFRYTPEILDILGRYGVQAAFFCIGSRVDQEPDLLRRVFEAGHVIGNHSYSHGAWFDLYSVSRMEKELQLTNDRVADITGKRPALFRPPYGVTNPNLAKAVKRTGMVTVGWNIRSLDTVAKDEERLFRKLMRSLQSGSILLFHDTAAITVKVLPRFIEAAQAAGYRFVRLDELINENPYA